MASLVQILAALSVLAAFVLVQARRLTPQARVYLVLNTAGAAVLAVDAAVHAQWGFLLLEGVWAAVSAWALVRSSSARRVRPA
jgi:hypothetical protein